MAIIIGKTAVQSSVVNTTSTSAFTLASFDYTALPGIGAVAIPASITANVKVLLFVPFDHGNRTWERTAVWSVTAGGSFALDGSENGNSGTLGIVGDANASTIAFDVSGNTGRVRVTPASTDSYLWYCRMDLTVVQFS